MCLILLAWQAHPDYPLVIAANRDEYFDRPTAPAQFWSDAPRLLAGRDLQSGGTWLGITREGRFAALTNFREPEQPPAAAPAPSRGELVSAFLTGQQSPVAYLTELEESAQRQQAANYRAFNLLCGTLDGELYYYSNRAPSERSTHSRIAPVTPGIHGLSNRLLDTPWPKVTRGKKALEQALPTLPDVAPLFQLLSDETRAADQDVPHTGISLEWERVLSSAYIRAPHYGTRSSTVLMFNGRDKTIHFDEQTSNKPSNDAAAQIQPHHRQFQFRWEK